MTNVAKALLILVLLVVSFGFTNKTDFTFTGTYGVSDNDPSQIELIINMDHTFSFQDYSNTDLKIDAKGNWYYKRNTIILNSTQTDAEFHNKWRISKDGQVVKS